MPYRYESSADIETYGFLTRKIIVFFSIKILQGIEFRDPPLLKN